MKFFNPFCPKKDESISRILPSILRELGVVKQQLDWIKTHMPTEAELDAKLAELKQAIADAAQRVLDKIAAITANNPDLTNELADVTTDIEALKNIAPADGGTGGAPTP